MNDKDIFENFLKRHSENEPKQMPRDLFQIVIFYKRPVEEELGLNKLEKFVCRNKIKANFVFPYYSEDIFMFPKEAENYIPRFIKKLIGEQKLPEDVIKNNTINYDLVETGIVPLNLSTLERIDNVKI